MCGQTEKLNHEALIEFDGKQVTCMEYESTLKEAGHLDGSEQCSSLVASFSDICCSGPDDVAVESEGANPTAAGCNICHRDNIRHELKAEAMVEYKGASLSCVDVNSILAKSETEGSEMCDATQSMLFDGCCYEKCSLCDGRSLKWDATVKYNNQILSCDEFSQLFSMSVTNKGDQQCDAMQEAYSQTCCYEPPSTPCNLCSDGMANYELMSNAFVKTRFAQSSHCMALFTQLAEREDESSQQCIEFKSAYFKSCCNTLSIPPQQSSPNNKSWNNWIADYMAPPSSGVAQMNLSFYALLTASLIGIIILIN
jgi:hypothetical protein